VAQDWLGRLLGRVDFASHEATPNGSRNGASVARGASEAKGVTLGAGVIPGTSGYQFFSPDGRVFYSAQGSGSDVDAVSRNTALLASAYLYVAMRWRMRKLSEPPLMVVEEDSDGTERWIEDHPLAELLENPSPDYDMGELIARTVAYIDLTGSALWVKDPTRGGLIGRLTPFSGEEFRVEPAADRIYGRFLLDVDGRGQFSRVKAPEEVVHFQEPNPLDWSRGISKVDVALQMLNLGQAAIAATKDILRNSLFPSVVIQSASDWNPSPDEWEAYKQAVDSYADRDKRGKPLVLLGGGTATKLAATMKDLLPGDILSRVEATVSAVFGVPAVVLQYQIGMENAPWSQMGEARRMAYDDTVVPDWNTIERTSTRQLLLAPTTVGGRPPETNRSRRIAFDKTDVRALQIDVVQMSAVAVQWEKIASLNERRALVGLEPVEDPAADEIPELTAPEPPPAGGDFSNPFANDLEPLDAEDVTAASSPVPLERKAAPELVWSHFDRSTKAAGDEWEPPIASELALERDAVVRIAERTLSGKTGRAGLETKAVSDDDLRAFLEELDSFIKTRATPRLRAIAYPLIFGTARAGVTAAAETLGLSFRVLQPGLLDYASRETVFLASVMGETLGTLIAELVQTGLEEGDTVGKLVQRIRSSEAAFGRTRAKLVARTETTRAWNGAQRATLSDYEARTGNAVFKSWLSARDARVRPEHVALDDGKYLPIDAAFDNGLLAPGEPNCRCTLTYSLDEVPAPVGAAAGAGRRGGSGEANA